MCPGSSGFVCLFVSLFGWEASTLLTLVATPIYTPPTLDKGEVRASLKAGSWRHELKQRPQTAWTACWITYVAGLACFFRNIPGMTTQRKHCLLGLDPLSSHIIKKIFYKLVYRKIWWRHLPNHTFHFPDDPNPYKLKTKNKKKKKYRYFPCVLVPSGLLS